VRLRSIILLTVIAVILSACGAPQPTATSAPLSTDTPVPTPILSPTPTIPLAVLIVPAELDLDTSNLYQKTVYDLTQQSGYRFQVRNTFSVADLVEPGLQVVIAVSTDPGIAELAAAAPQVQFLAINIPNIAAGGNVSVLGNNTQSDIAAFLAGYTAAMITDDYRIGMLIPRDNGDAIRALNAYAAGMAYYCGVCHPLYFFNWTFPQYLDIGAEEDKNNYDAYADILMMQYKVRTIYLYPDIYTEDLANYIGTTGTYVFGTISPEQRPAGWVMTIQPDVIKAIQNAWPKLIGGQGGVTVQSPLGLSDVDPTILTPGKQRLVEQTLNDLQAGLIGINKTP
jgi:hypothetical protein